MRSVLQQADESPSRPCVDFDHDRSRFAAEYRTRWWRSSTELPDFGAEIPRRRQRQNERRIDRFSDLLEREILAYPGDALEREAWRRRLRERVRCFGDSVLPLAAAERRVIFSEAYFDATARFAREARAFDPELKIHDLSQALRNVWIMHLLQLLLEQQIHYTPAVLAYSLLYPYTDNHLDQPDLTASAKRTFCQRLERRLAGQRPLPRNAHEQSVFRLIGIIESEFSRADFPAVYASLLAIHHAQTESLRQQGRMPCEAEVLALSVEKGGASVLADGYLVAGELDREEADFIFGYGVFLQLADDLQDLEQDLGSNHVTLFSRHAISGSATARPLDHLANRLVHFLDGVLASERFADARFAVLKSLIRNSCVQLIVQSAAASPKFFTRPYLRILQRHSLTRFSYLRRKSGGLRKCYRRLNDRLSRETPLDSIFEALG